MLMCTENKILLTIENKTLINKVAQVFELLWKLLMVWVFAMFIYKCKTKLVNNNGIDLFLKKSEI